MLFHLRINIKQQVPTYLSKYLLMGLLNNCVVSTQTIFFLPSNVQQSTHCPVAVELFSCCHLPLSAKHCVKIPFICTRVVLLIHDR